MSNKTSSLLDQFLLFRMQEGNISSTTLVFTFFCDVVTQHGGEIWMGSIIRALAPLGINERLTRTSVFRLVQDSEMRLETLPEPRRVADIIGSIPFMSEYPETDRLLELVSDLAARVPCRRLHFQKDPGFLIHHIPKPEHVLELVRPLNIAKDEVPYSDSNHCQQYDGSDPRKA